MGKPDVVVSAPNRVIGFNYDQAGRGACRGGCNRISADSRAEQAAFWLVTTWVAPSLCDAARATRRRHLNTC